MDALELTLAAPGRPPLVVANPRLPEERVEPLRRALEAVGERFAGHVAVASSGTTASVPGEDRWVLLGRDALLASAGAVNRHLDASPDDVWLDPLPGFHVGGIGIRARAHLAGVEVVPLVPWDPHRLCQVAEERGATLTALVPAMVFDLAARSLPAPARLRAAVVGGGTVAGAVARRARALGWPLLQSYGLSECASQVATAHLADPPGSDALLVLDHVEAMVDASGRLAIRSPALLTTYAFVAFSSVRFHDPKEGGVFTTDDLVELQGPRLRFLGRRGDVVKVSGENVDLGRLGRLLDELRLAHAPALDLALVARPDERKGARLELLAAPGAEEAEGEPPERLLERFNALVMPFERLAGVRRVSRIDRTALGKLGRRAERG